MINTDINDNSVLFYSLCYLFVIAKSAEATLRNEPKRQKSRIGKGFAALEVYRKTEKQRKEIII